MNNDKELDEYIGKHIDGLTAAQAREARLMAKDLMGLVIDECRNAAQQSVNQISAINKRKSD
ncbi:hypothetical protein [Vibrio crassostreae]|uniref:hypothetical protein n=1 Tax=Vibrio crassostreae TaxID=246167 RepID=UPI001B31321F|nr:hypothetical protein [Vibrio crassostreae]